MVFNLVKRASAPTLITATGMLMLCWTRLTWPDILIDFGREAYVPWQLANGKVLYRDIAYFNGPLSPYLNTLWFRAFGDSLFTLFTANLILLAVLVFLLHRLLSMVSNNFSATIACVILMPLFAFGQFRPTGNYNFIAPYSHELTHGLLLCFVALYCLAGYMKSRVSVWLAGMGFVLGLAFLTKPEIFLAVAAACLSGLFSLVWLGRSGGKQPSLPAWGVVLFVVSLLVPPLFTIFLLALAMPASDAILGVISSWKSLLQSDVTSLAFYQKSMGIDNLFMNTLRMLTWSATYALLLATSAWIAIRISTSSIQQWVASFLLFFLYAGMPFFFSRATNWKYIATPLPLAMGVLAVLCVRRLWRHESEPETLKRDVLRLALIVLAGTLLVKMLLYTRIFHYGFTLALPASLVAIVALLSWIPTSIDQRGGSGTTFRAAALGLLFGMIVIYLSVMNQQIKQKSFDLRFGNERIRTDQYRGKAVASVLATLEARLNAEDRLVVLPEGIMLNYLLRRTNPTPYLNFMPTELEIFGEKRIVAALYKAAPKIVVLVHKNTSEYGFPFFGKDYGQTIFDWVIQNYRPILQIGDKPLVPGTRFGIQVFERVNPSDSNALLH